MLDDEFEPPEPIEGIFVDVARAELRPPSWIIQDLLPPGLTFLAGPPKSRKSTISAACAALVAEYQCTALPMHLSTVRQFGPVLWLSAEALAGEIRHMIEDGLGVGKLEPREAILVAECPWDFRLDDPGALEKLMYWLKKRDPRLLIIDPLRDFHGGEERDSGVMNRLLRPLRTWAVENDSAVMVVHHTKKVEQDKDTTYSALDMRGTTALFGIADGVLMLTPRGKEAEGRIFVQATFKRAAGWEKEITLAAYGASDAVEHLADIDVRIGTLMASGVTDLADIARQLNVGMSEVMASLARVSVVKKGSTSKWVTKQKS